MITTEPDRDHKVKIGDQYYRPILLKVEYQQDLSPKLTAEEKQMLIDAKEESMMDRLNSAIDQHVTKSGVIRGGHLHTNKIEIMILKPIKNGK